ncbi:hypothetical protein WR25_11325 [Diploscapter pachys]|uniref:Uncharacterized protein n=1 Tax=Diploscapter pachys TaxID=2018661 RepID=A0A2A2JIU2_9BILA|nr:hypothetical protein WR25_11325 [Diploscapter pachys]
MIDQSNRNGRPAQVNVFKNRRRNRSDASPGGGPSPDLGLTYSPDPASVVAASAAAASMAAAGPYGPAGADLYARSMFPSAGYGMLPNPMNTFMNPMMSFPGSQPLNPWMDPLLAPQWHENAENGAAGTDPDKNAATAKPLF